MWARSLPAIRAATLGLLAALVLLVSPAVAPAAITSDRNGPVGRAAERAATPSEASGVAAAVNVDQACLTVRISTANENWALAYSSDNPDCAGANGAITLKLTVTGWRIVEEGGGYPFPCPIRGIPTVVARDFDLCRPLSRHVYVSAFGRLAVRPARMVQGAHGGYVRLRWRGWGSPTAVGRGTLDYVDAELELRIPVRVTLSRRRACGFKRAYTRMSARPVRARDRARFPGFVVRPFQLAEWCP